ncbi:hypothetical protein D9M70_633820 [compost metagenome]
MFGKLAPVAGAGPIHLRAIAGEKRIPIVGAAIGRLHPAGQLRRVVAHLEHVVAGAEAEMLKCGPERTGAGAADAGTDDLQGHVFLPCCAYAACGRLVVTS